MGADGEPPPAVLEAFRVRGPVRRLTGGQGTAWSAGAVVLKPAGLVAESEWRAEVLRALHKPPGIRVVRPVASDTGAWTADGWEAWDSVTGQADPRRLDDVLAVGRTFHKALEWTARPSWLDVRDNPWAYGDRVAWGELPVDGATPWRTLLDRLAALREPCAMHSQAVHPDLLGNVLFAPALAPAVIDWAVYFRPALWADAVVVVDAITWHGAPDAALAGRSGHPDWYQAVLRALMFRIATNVGRQRVGQPVTETPAAYDRVLQVVSA